MIRNKRFWKLQGVRNSFIFFLDSDIPSVDEIRTLTDVHLGAGSDGVIGIASDKDENGAYPVWMRNPDGSKMGMCGNGIRCAHRLLHHLNIIEGEGSEVTFDVEGRLIECVTLNAGRNVTVNMGRFSFDPVDIPLSASTELVNELTPYCDFPITALGLGNPHCVVFVEDLERDFNAEVARRISSSTLFPEGCNVEFAEIKARDSILLEVVERGAGRTLACGTGACAASIAAHRLGLSDKNVSVELPGGVLLVYLDSLSETVKLSGDADLIFEGIFI